MLRYEALSSNLYFSTSLISSVNNFKNMYRFILILSSYYMNSCRFCSMSMISFMPIVMYTQYAKSKPGIQTNLFFARKKLGP